MPAEYAIIHELNLKYVSVEGETNLSELRDLAREYIDDPMFSLKQRQLIDLSMLTDAKAKFLDVLTLRNFYLREYGQPDKPVPVAIYAPTDLGYGISRMFSSLMLGQKLMLIKIFERKIDALSWLNIDPMGALWIDGEVSREGAYSSRALRVSTK